MVINQKRIKYELVGQLIEVVDSTNPANKGIKGIVVDETRYTMLIKTSKENKRIIKRTADFIIGNHMVSGSKLVGRPEERLKVSR